MRKKSTPVAVRFGSIEFLKVNAATWQWRDIYHWLLSQTWPRFATFLLSCYVGVNVIFACLFMLVADGVAELKPGSFPSAFFFSVETLATVGYGHTYPVSLAAHLVATAEIITGMFGMAVTTGLIFVRFSRPTANLLFSQALVISKFDDKPTLMVRIANQRHQPMVEVQFRIMMIRTETLPNGETLARFHELPLQVGGVIVFPAALTVRHIIDEHSPLHGKTPEDFEKESVRFVVSVACVDTVVPAALHSHQNYTWHDVRFGHRFVEIYTEAEGDGRWFVDYGKLHETEPYEV